ncbi:MAG: DEAD/DEAH box helicase [Sphingobacteriales bacterium JAD_PAG50586_3]|nr:MAG: DEAD/DEAH box helicase [Sphingobacteriales bacterium JAD_PAG50586_3]
MNNFQSLGLSDKLVAAVTSLGFETPTPVQKEAIPVLLEGPTDLVCLSQTGTGKTAAFGLPLIELADDQNRITQALILAPTRELCVQIKSDLVNYCKGVKPLNIVPVYGGASIQDQIKQIRKGAQIIVATPGRLMDLMDRKAIDIGSVGYVVLDEADEMLNMGFKDDIDFILSHTPKEKNVWLFSATMPVEIQRISKKYMTEPYEISVGSKNQGNENITHLYMMVDDRNRYEALKRVVDINPDVFGVIFCRTKAETQDIAEKLMKDGYNADALHGDLSQAQRDKVMKAFKAKTLQLLIATDVAARGIDVSNITHVFHMNLPDEVEYYTHRSGRTARAGKTGFSIAIITRRDMHKIRQIEKKANVNFVQTLVPTGVEVCEKRVLELVHRLHDVKINEKDIASFLPAVFAELEDLSKEEIITRFASLEFNRYFDYYSGSADLNKKAEPRDRDRDGGKDRDGGRSEGGRGERSGSRADDGDYERMFMSIGKMEGLDNGKLLGFILQRCNVPKRAVGRITVKGAYSFFEAETEFADTIKNMLHGFDYKGRRIRVEIETDKPKREAKKKTTYR